MELSDSDNVMSCDPANARRSQVPGPASVKLATEVCTEVGDQASVTENATGRTKRNLVQQAFHPSLFTSRSRSSSLGSNPNIASTSNKNLTPTAPGATSIDNGVHTCPPIFSAEPSRQGATLPPPWQRALTAQIHKRRRTSNSPPMENMIQTSNSFSGLPLDQPDSDHHIPKPIPVSKPPPIILYGIEDVNELTKLIETVSEKSHFKFRIVNKNLMRVLVDSADEYKKIIQLIREKGLIGHTFTRKDTKCYRIVIKNLHHTTPHNAIVEEIEATGNKVRGEIINARYGPNKNPTSTFFVNIEPSPNNKSVKDIKYIYHQHVKIEDPRKSKTIVQCQRCQQYGHSKNNCMRPYRCVKCGEGHKTSECTKKDRNTPAKCALCSCDHPANYKGCIVYQEILARKINSSQKKSRQSEKTLPSSTDRNSDNTASTLGKTTRPDMSYARATAGAYYNMQSNNDDDDKSKSNVILPHLPPQSSNLEALLLKQSEKMDILFQQIGSLLALLTKLVTKLAP